MVCKKFLFIYVFLGVLDAKELYLEEGDFLSVTACLNSHEINEAITGQSTPITIENQYFEAQIAQAFLCSSRKGECAPLITKDVLLSDRKRAASCSAKSLMSAIALDSDNEDDSEDDSEDEDYRPLIERKKKKPADQELLQPNLELAKVDFFGKLSESVLSKMETEQKEGEKGLKPRRKRITAKPLMSDFQKEEEYLIALVAWKNYRKKNSKAVRECRARKRAEKRAKNKE